MLMELISLKTTIRMRSVLETGPVMKSERHSCSFVFVFCFCLILHCQNCNIIKKMLLKNHMRVTGCFAHGEPWESSLLYPGVCLGVLTYLWDSLFSGWKFSKNKYRTCLTDEHFHNLRISVSCINPTMLCQVSH